MLLYVLSFVVVLLLIAIFFIFMIPRNETDPSDKWDNIKGGDFIDKPVLTSLGERNLNAFKDSIERIQNVLHQIAKGALCNVLHDDNLIPDFGDLDCKVVIEVLKISKETLIQETQISNIDELNEARHIVIDELSILIHNLVEMNCVENMINASFLRELIMNYRNDACGGLNITPYVLSDFIRNMLL